MVIWLYSFGAFLVCRYIVWIVNGFTNNVYDVYDLVLPATGTGMAVLNLYAWLLMFSYHYEISQTFLFKKLRHINVCGSLLFVLRAYVDFNVFVLDQPSLVD